MYKLLDQFTTRDGSWTPNGEPYSITPEMAEKYGASANELGCAICLFVKLEGGPGGPVRFTTNAGMVERHDPEPNGWAHTTMYNPGSGYNPNNNIGPWTVQADQAESDQVGGIGLPFGWHVSTFVVLKWVDGDEGGGEVDPGPGPDPIEPPVQERIWVEVKVGSTYYNGYLDSVVS